LQEIYFQQKQSPWNKQFHAINIQLTRIVDQLLDEVRVLVWGTASFAHATLANFLEPEESPIAEVIASDWILDARLIDGNTVGLVTAHNTLLIYSLETRNFLQRFNCEEQSLLYSAQIYLTGDKDIIIAAGTVFNEIQLWRPFANCTSNNPSFPIVVPVHGRLVGHEGCIFSLRFNESGSLLASCSDDRTVRMWDVKEQTFLAIGFAHVARVWDVRFVPSHSTDHSYLLSSSEDTTALLWQYLPGTRKLKVQERYHGHSGKHVWSQAISSDGTMAATGGNDGAVNIWDVGGWKDRTGKDLNDVFWTEKPIRVSVDGKEMVDSIKGYQCVDDDRLILTTKSGYCRTVSPLIAVVCMYITYQRRNGYCFSGRRSLKITVQLEY
jgi:WD repeat-containing protein 6